MNEGDRLLSAVVCSPGPDYFGVPDLEEHGMVAEPDPERAATQHAELVRTLKKFGAKVKSIAELAGHPNSVFTRDPALGTPEGVLLLRMGLPTRSGEPEWLGRELERLGTPIIGAIEPPGTVEGGDVILMGDVAFVGRSDRTNEEGIRQLRSRLSPMGYKLRVADLRDRYLHLGSVMSAIGPATVVVREGIFDAVFDRDFLEGFEALEVPDGRGGEAGANVLCLVEGDVVVDVSEDGPCAEALESRGVRVHALNLSEFRKGGGGPTCTVLPVARGG